MDAAVFEQVYEAFQDFSRLLRSAVWTQGVAGSQPTLSPSPAGAIRGAAQRENLSETVPASARAMQRFLTEAPWDDDLVTGHLQEYLGPGWSTRRRCGCWTAATFPSRAESPWGWHGSTVGDWARWPTAKQECSWHTSVRWGGHWWTSGLYLPESWTSDSGRCDAAGVPAERRRYRSKTELALEMVARALERDHLKAGWVAGDDAFGMSPSFRNGLAALGMRYVLDVPAGFTAWPTEPEWTSPAYQGLRAAPQAQAGGRAAADHAERSDECRRMPGGR